MALSARERMVSGIPETPSLLEAFVNAAFSIPEHMPLVWGPEKKKRGILERLRRWLRR